MVTCTGTHELKAPGREATPPWRPGRAFYFLVNVLIGARIVLITGDSRLDKQSVAASSTLHHGFTHSR